MMIQMTMMMMMLVFDDDSILHFVCHCLWKTIVVFDYLYSMLLKMIYMMKIRLSEVQILQEGDKEGLQTASLKLQ